MFYFFSETLLISGDRQEQEDESLPSTAAMENRAKPPRQHKAHQSGGKGKGHCQKHSAIKDIGFSHDKLPSTDFFRQYMDDSPFKHIGSLGSFFNLHFFLRRYFLGVSYRRVSYLEDRIPFQYQNLSYRTHNMCRFTLGFCPLEF